MLVLIRYLPTFGEDEREVILHTCEPYISRKESIRLVTKWLDENVKGKASIIVIIMGVDPTMSYLEKAIDI